ncbi:MAG: hypothetical protein QOD99_610 [Chthoniobacter sp.]|jgi:hypothetical protein|nr:hypothetical protein [Chthoniobacter sp.]
MPKLKKKADEMTDKELLRALFAKVIRNELKKVARKALKKREQ